jgi:acetylornithine deacetylase/succinyl-diaminopimelate desuccinylase-like protein
MRGPGVRDNASGLIGLIEAARALKAMKVSPPGDIWLLATAQEEIGLFGARKFLDDHAGQVARFVAVDGELGEVSHGATGIVWLKVHFLAEGGHTLQSAAAPSAVRAAARAIDAIYDIGVPASPEQRASWLSVSTIGGGDAVNAMARDAWFTVDLRSNSPKLLEKLEADVRAAAGLAARRTRVGVAIEELLRMPGASLPGHEGSAFVRLALECQAAAGWPSPRASLLGTADHNRALERGIPGISVGVTTGAAIHTPQESASIQALPTGIAALALLMASLPSEP